MRLYIGTLHTIEKEFEDCVKAIQAQTFKDFDHHIIHNLPNREAHTALFQSFLEKKDRYDLLIKVDADMVITNPQLFEKIVERMQAHPEIEILTIAVQDFFSDRLIYGLNTYRNTVRWDFSKENLFVDIPETPNERYMADNTQLAPAATHCPNPSPYQAFHYGVHRGLKVIQPGQKERRESGSRTHWNSLELTWAHFLKINDVRLGLACLGAELAYAGVFEVSDLDFSAPKVHTILEKFDHLDPGILRMEIQKIRWLNWGILPHSRRRKVLCSALGISWSKVWVPFYDKVKA